MRENIKVAWIEYLRRLLDDIEAGDLELVKAYADPGFEQTESGVRHDGRWYIRFDVYDSRDDRAPPENS